VSLRLFVAVWPPADVLDAVARVPRPEVAGVRWTTPDQWHVTLRFLGSVESVEPVAAALSAISVAPVRAIMGPAVARLSRHVLCVPVAGLDDVASAVVDATAGLGKPPEDRPFKGHLTLARARDRRADLRPLAGPELTGEWDVTDVCLVESRLHPKGARYEVLDRFSLG
jgi:2'-5' RNA ligase